MIVGGPVACETCGEIFSSQRFLSAHATDSTRCTVNANIAHCQREGLMRCPGAWRTIFQQAGVPMPSQYVALPTLPDALHMLQSAAARSRPREYEICQVAPSWAVLLWQEIAYDPSTYSDILAMTRVLRACADRVRQEPSFADTIEVLCRLAGDASSVLEALAQQGIPVDLPPPIHTSPV